MAKDLNNSAEQNSSHINEDDTEKSIVGKFKSIISNTPLSKWFRKHDDNVKSTIRRRDEEEEDDDINQIQPPSKRARFPASVTENNFNVLSSSDNTSDKLVNKTYNHFPEPVAGPSGLKSRKLLSSVSNTTNSVRNVFTNDLLNGHKDSDSEESTSGYSSVARIGSKEHVSQSEGSSKQPSPLQTNSLNTRSLFQSPVANTNRSLFTERTASPNLNTSLSSRRPCFNTSTFGSPNFIDKTISTEKIINSPFYNGTTIYGGASAYGTKLGRRDLRTSLKRSVHIKPINKAKNSGSSALGKTARKILETLEQYSTPVNDAKKIPVASKRFRPDNSLLGKHVGLNPYISQSESPSNRELHVPTVADLLKMKQKAKLQSSTEAARQIAISSQLDLNTVSPHTITKESEKKSTENCSEMCKLNTKVGGPLYNDKSQISSNLPISSKPKFDSIIPSTILTKKSSEKDIENPVISSTSKTQIIQESPANVETNRNFQKDLPSITSQFKFSNPLVIAENLKSIVAMNNFKFSEPLSSMNKGESNIKTTNSSTKSVKEKNNGQNITANVLSNSYLLDKFKPAEGTWECGNCLIRNQPNKSKCIACDAPNPKLKSPQTETKKTILTTTPSFGDKFKMQDGMWECPACLIRNSSGSAKCVACETANPKSLVSSSLSGFQGKFQPPANTWECSTCLIRNKEDLIKCAACETPRISKAAINQLTSSSFQGQFQPPPNTWECSTCLIRNKEEFSKCVACESSRMMKLPATNPVINSFKIKQDQWECTVCLVRNNADHLKCQCCEASKPGTNSNFVAQEKKPIQKFNFGIDQKTATSFKFGVPPSSATPSLEKSVVAPSVAIEEVAKSNNTTTPTFSFGITPKIQESQKESTNSAETKTSLVKSSTNSMVSKPVVTLSEKTEASTSLFKSTTSTPLSLTTDKDSGSTKPVNSSSTYINIESTAKSSFNFGSKFENKDKESNLVTPIPKFEFRKPAESQDTPTTLQNQQPLFKTQNSDFKFGETNKPVVSSISVFGQNQSSLLKNGLDVKSTPTFGILTNTVNSSGVKPVETKPFSFTPDSAEPGTKAPKFNFGQSAGSSLNPPTTQSGFNFGQATKPPVFNFSGNKNETSLSSSPVNPFSASNMTSNSKNGIFNFGSNSQNTGSQKAGFNFGTPSAPPSSGFNFGAPAPAVPPALSGFNFTAAFNANAKPSFNFSDSPVTFAAQPLADGGLPPARKIKRAVRKTR